jgi:type VI secretion system protein ImpH
MSEPTSPGRSLAHSSEPTPPDYSSEPAPLDHLSGLALLRDAPHQFSLFAALRLVERAYADRPRLGESRRASEDAIRLAQPPYLTFVPTELAGLQSPEDGPPRLEEYSFGLFGPNGPLPLHFTEVAYERQRQLNDPTFSDFLNFLQHRLIALFYRAWAESDPATCHDRPNEDRFKLYLGSMLGLGFEASAARDVVLDHAKLSRAAQFSAQTRSAEGLEDVLADYFELPIGVRSFAPAWLDIPADSYTRLGDRSQNAQLGMGTTLGSASWQSQHQFEIVIGPLTLTTFEHFLPGTPGLRELAALVRLYTNDEWSWILRLRLAAREVPAMQLGMGSRLGWTSWVGGRDATAEDVIIRGDI